MAEIDLTNGGIDRKMSYRGVFLRCVRVCVCVCWGGGGGGGLINPTTDKSAIWHFINTLLIAN